MHPDRKTNAPDTEYFFLGDGFLSVAIQWSKNPEMSPYGILLWGTEAFQRKDGTALFHPELGLGGTMLTVVIGSQKYRPTHETTRVWWESSELIEPVVGVEWIAGDIRVVERFSVASWNDEPPAKDRYGISQSEFNCHFLRRDILLLPNAQSSDVPSEGSIVASLYPNPILYNQLPMRRAESELFGSPSSYGDSFLTLEANASPQYFERFFTFVQPVDFQSIDSNEPDDRDELSLFYRLPDYLAEEIPSAIKGEKIDLPLFNGNQEQHLSFAQRLLRQLEISRIGINGTISEDGAFNASIWQYGYEWGQDAAMLATACCYVGDFEIAKAILSHILLVLTSDDGHVAESSRFRDGELTELNANGAVLLALRDYYWFTRDGDFLRRNWSYIGDIVALLCEPEHLHPSGLLVGRRDLWERLPWMGLLSGFDVATNTFCSEGLIAASYLAGLLGIEGKCAEWRELGETMHRAMFNHLTFSFVEDNRIVHRRLLDGTVQTTMVAEARYGDQRYIPYVPDHVADITPRLCDPDSVSALPILYNLIDPRSTLAQNTLNHLHEHLWNPTGIGGYGRSPIPSDPDSPGPWPFVTAWMAEAELKGGMTERAKETTEWLLTMANNGGNWFEYYGERQSPPYPPTGIIVWGWGQYLLLAIRGWMGIEVTGKRLRIAPQLVPFEHRFWVGDHYVNIEVSGLRIATVEGLRITLVNGGIEIPLPLEKNLHIHFSN
ncbi:MAG: hypothetical protein KDD67_04635 [Ignavibacteriae bacterium]|nr:hypothetical protein [Ignavibacteriota bacterium]MCB9216383.1 hypothetical protein [Ignavibacteria bacterium]